MSDSEIKISCENAMKQAGMTANDYLDKSYKILKDEYEDWTVSDAIELAKIMAQDFHTSMICMKLQEIRDQLEEIDKSL